MKKLSYLLLVAMFCVFNENATFAKSFTGANTALAASSEEFVDSVEAQDASGRNTIYLGIYGRRMANGSYHYFAKTKGGTREFNIQYADNNKYKPFYVIINNVRWYFSSRALDYNSGKQSNGRNINF